MCRGLVGGVRLFGSAERWGFRLRAAYRANCSSNARLNRHAAAVSGVRAYRYAVSNRRAVSIP